MRIWRLTAPVWNRVKRSRVQWMIKDIAKCDVEHATQVYCRRRADITVFQKRFAGTEQTVLFFQSVL